MNEFNKKRRPHGFWESYYPNTKTKTNRMFFRGNFNDGLKIGHWIYFERNGTLKFKLFYI